MALNAGESLVTMHPGMNLIVDSTGAIVGIQNTGATGADFRGGGGSTRTYRGVVASQAAMLALSPVSVGDWCARSDLSNQIFELTVAGPATLANWTGYAAGAATFAALTDATTATIPTTNTPLANALLGKSDKGRIARAADVTTGRAFTGADFGIGVLPLNNVAVQNFTVNTQSTMGTTGVNNMLPLQILAAAHTLTAGAGVTITYGATAYVGVAVSGFTPVLNQTYVLAQRGSLDTWDLS